MADYNLGTAHGTIKIDADTAGADKAGQALEDIGKKGASTGEQLSGVGTKVGLAGAAIAGGLGLAVKTAADFEQGLSNIKAVSGATTDQMDKIHDKALQIGKDTAFGATEAASAMEELAKAGLSIDDILGGAADATVALAAAGGVDMPTAATIASNAMNQFGLTAKDMGNTVNLIAGAANASAIDVTDFGMSMSQVGAVANLAGLSFGDTAVAIAELGNAGIKGSDAGTSLKTMLSNLQPTTKTAADAMKQLGIITADGSNKFYDAQGNVKSLGEIQQVLQDSTKDLTAGQKQMALQTIFGSDAIRAAAVMADQGAAGFDKMNASMSKVSAADVAATRMDNLNGAVEQFKGGVETAAITIGEQLIPLLKSLTAGLGSVFDWFNSLSPGTQSLITGFLAAAAATLTVGAAILKAVSVISKMKTAFAALNLVMKANPILAVISVIVLLVTMFITAYATSETFRDKVNAAFQAVGKVVGVVVDAIIAAWNWVKDAFSAVGDWISTNVPKVFNTVKDFLAKWGPAILAVLAPFIGIPLLIHQHWDEIVAFFKGIPGAIMSALGSLGGWLAGLFTSAWNGILTGLHTAWDATMSFLAGLPNMLAQGLGWLVGTVARLAVDGFMGLLNGAVTAWNATYAFVTSLPGKIVEGLAALAGMLIAAAITAWNGFTSGLTTAWNATITWLASVPGMIRDGLIALTTFLIQVAIDAWNGFTSGLSTAWSATLSWLQSVPGLVLGALQALGTMLLTAATTAWNSFQTGITTAFTATLAWFQALPGVILGTLGDVGSWLLTAGGDIIQGLWNGIQAAWGGIISWLSGLWQSFIDGFKSAFGISSPSTLFLQFGQWILEGLLNGLQAMVGSITSFFAGFIQNILGAFAAAGTWLLDKGKALLQGLLNGITSMVGSVISGLQGLIQSAIGAFAAAGSWLVSKGSELIRGFISGITSMLANVGGAAQNIISAAKGAFSGAASWLVGVGADMIRGLIGGIGSMASAAANAAKGVAQKALGAVTSFLNIGSPSKLMRDEVGKWIPPGIAVGIEANADEAINAARALAANVAGSMTMTPGGASAFWDASGIGAMSIPPSPEVSSYAASQGEPAQGPVTNIETNIYNPVAEKASDSEARRLRTLSALGAF